MSADLQETLDEYIIISWQGDLALYHKPTGLRLVTLLDSTHLGIGEGFPIGIKTVDMTAHMIEATQSGLDDPDWEDTWTVFTHLSDP